MGLPRARPGPETVARAPAPCLGTIKRPARYLGPAPSPATPTKSPISPENWIFPRKDFLGPQAKVFTPLASLRSNQGKYIIIDLPRTLIGQMVISESLQFLKMVCFMSTVLLGLSIKTPLHP